MPSSAIDDALWEMVLATTGGILATIDANGFPHLSNVNYLVDAEAMVVRVTTTVGRVKGRNLLRNPKVALHVQGEDSFHFAVVEGTAAAAIAERPGDAATDGLHAIFSKFRGDQERPAFDEEMIAKGRMIVDIPVARVYGLNPPPTTGRSAT